MKIDSSLDRFLREPLVSVSPEQTVLDAARLMWDQKVGSVVVTRQYQPIGILTDRDIIIRVTAQKRDPVSTRIHQVMSHNPVVAPENSGLWEVIQKMKKHAVRRIPIVSDKGHLIGIITMDDLIEIFGAQLAALRPSGFSTPGPAESGSPDAADP